MIEAITTEKMVVGTLPRPYADPAQFGALVARIDGDIEVLARDRRNLALVRRNVLAICIVYAIAAFCVQDAIRGDASHTKPVALGQMSAQRQTAGKSAHRGAASAHGTESLASGASNGLLVKAF